MKKNGFTLVEVLAVITIVSVMAVITVTAVQGITTKTRQKAYEDQQNTILIAAKFYFSDSKIKGSDLKNIGDVSLVRVTTLQEQGYIADLINPLTGNPYDSDDAVKVTLGLNNKLSYVFLSFTNESCFVFDSGTGTITNYYYSKSYCGLDVVIPPQISGVNVIAIGNYAFNFPSTSKMKSLDLSNVTHLQSIGEYSFWGTNSGYASDPVLENFNMGVLPELVSIGRGAFKALGVSGVLDLSLFTSLTTIGLGAFSENFLTDIVYAPNLTSIANYAFQINMLTTVVYPAPPITVGDSVFASNKITSLTIPNGVTTIPNSSFSQNPLTSVTLPSTLVSIGSFAFNNCKLTSVTIPSSVISIGGDAFSRNLLTSVTLNPGITTLGAYSFQYNKITSITIPSTVTAMGEYVFSSNLLTSINLTGVTAISNSAFSSNPNLATVIIPASVTAIGTYAFSGAALTSVTMGKTGTTIGDYMMGGSNNYFRTSYTAGGVGTYTGTQTGTWTKV